MNSCVFCAAIKAFPGNISAYGAMFPSRARTTPRPRTELAGHVVVFRIQRRSIPAPSVLRSTDAHVSSVQFHRNSPQEFPFRGRSLRGVDSLHLSPDRGILGLVWRDSCGRISKALFITSTVAAMMARRVARVVEPPGGVEDRPRPRQLRRPVPGSH
jgi:hypothetical protein